MYDFVDRPVTSLDRGGRFLIWALRSWTAWIGHKECPARAIAPAFARSNMIGALQPFHRTMLLINRDALENFGFCSLNCNRVSEHEAIIVTMIRMLGEDRPAAVRDTLSLLIEEDSIGDVLASLCELASRMDEAALFPGCPAAARAPQSSNRRP